MILSYMAVKVDPSDPRSVLASWANSNDEWVRYLVKQVLSTGTALDTDHLDYAYDLFRQEKLLDLRALPEEPVLELADSPEEASEQLKLTKICDVTGVNAIGSAAVIEPHDGLTILFGENGTGKTGYSRLLKALAKSRTADVILGNIDTNVEAPQSATVEYQLGVTPGQFAWTGEQGKAPFTRMSIFDSPAVNFHVDEDLEYVYVPAALALFTHVNAAIGGVQVRIEEATAGLKSRSKVLLTRFSRDSSVFPHIETLGAATELGELKKLADLAPNADDRVAARARAVAALEADTVGSQIAIQNRLALVMAGALRAVAVVSAFDPTGFDEGLAREATLQADYKQFRQQLFAAADIPGELDETWAAFVASGDEYQEHLKAAGAHDEARCPYCRQPLATPARSLLLKYREYLEDKIAADITAAATAMTGLVLPIQQAQLGDLGTYLSELEDVDPVPQDVRTLREAHALVTEVKAAVDTRTSIRKEITQEAFKCHEALVAREAAVAANVQLLRDQSVNRAETLANERKALVELSAAVELGRSWPQVEAQVADAKELNRLAILGKALPTLKGQVTDRSKASSDRMINQSFDALFAEECVALRAPKLKIQFVGRDGKAKRRKALQGKYKPSKILSEGEQKVLAIADFLAEARLSGITATVVFDDPVSSLDHRRVDEVAERVAKLAATTQVIVFTHDILFATKLLSLFETSKRCIYYQVTDEDEKGTVTRSTGPRWDTLSNLKTRINQSVTDAKAVQGEIRAAFVRTGYDWIRAWCEVFTEMELLQSVTQRYQPNVRMTALPNIKVSALAEAITTVVDVFERACRYIDGHSQPLASQGVGPTLAGLEADWKTLQECRTGYSKG